MGREHLRIHKQENNRHRPPPQSEALVPDVQPNPAALLRQAIEHQPLLQQPENVQQIQSLIGNQATQRLLIQRLPSGAEALRQHGAPEGITNTMNRFRYGKLIDKLDDLNLYILNTALGVNRNEIMGQFMHLRDLYASVYTAAVTYFNNLSAPLKESDTGAFVWNLLPRINKEEAQLVPIMLHLLDNVGRYQAAHMPQPKLHIVLSSNRNVGRPTTVDTQNRLRTVGGGMNVASFYNQGIFKAPKMHLTNELLANPGGETEAMDYGEGHGMTRVAAQNEFWIGGQDLGLRQSDSLMKREVAMSYLDRLLGAGMLAKTELALQRDGVNVTEGILMQSAGNTKMGDWITQHGAASIRTNPVMRDLSKLQLLDLLALQIDRHTNNYMVHTDVTGQIVRLVGFDHDMAFGRRGGWESGHTKEIPGLAEYVDRELAQRIVDLDPEMLRWVMQGLLEPDVIDFLLARLDKLKTHLREHIDKWLNPDQWETVMNSEQFKSDKSYINRVSPVNV